jgi:hypothetical protein
MKIEKAKRLIAAHLKRELNSTAWRYYNWSKDTKTGIMRCEVRLAYSEIFRVCLIDKQGNVDSYNR